MPRVNEEKNLRVFGFGLAGLAAFLGWGAFIKEGGTVVALTKIGLSVFFLFAAIGQWRAFGFAYRLWMMAVRPLGELVVICLFSAVYWLLFTPLGLLLRMLGKDFLSLKKDREVQTFWQVRGQDGPKGPERYLKQY